MLFAMEPSEYWRKLKTIIEEVVEQKTGSTSKQTLAENPPQKKLLKAKEVCELFHVSKPTIYEWLKQGKLKSIKIESRRYFLCEDIEDLIRNSKSMPDPAGKIPSSIWPLPSGVSRGENNSPRNSGYFVSED